MTNLIITAKKARSANIKIRNVKVFNDMKITEHSTKNKEQKTLWKEVFNEIK